MIEPKACGHPKIGTCKNCGKELESEDAYFSDIDNEIVHKNKDSDCEIMENTSPVTQSDIDKYHVERLKEALKLINDKVENTFFPPMVELKRKENPFEIIESVIKCLSGKE